jgi:regulator of sigma E protease
MIAGFLLFIGLIIVHEFGHFWAAKKSGVQVEEFGLGFPPRLYGRRFGGDETLYSVNLLPLGGFVRLKGEHDADRAPGSYGAASFRQKTVIILAGVAMNLLAAAVIFTGLSLSGMPRLLPNQVAVAADTDVTRSEVLVSFVAEGSSAEAAGIRPGDELVSFNGEPLDSSDELFALAEASLDQNVKIELIRGQQAEQVSVQLPPQRTEQGILGLTPADLIVERSTWSAPLRGLALTGQFAWETLKGVANLFGQLFSGQGAAAADNVTGPVGIVLLLGDVAAAGASSLWVFIGLISVTLAVMNTLPIPALDGGRLFVSWLYRSLKRPLNSQTEERIHATGMALLLTLIALITIVDVRRFF